MMKVKRNIGTALLLLLSVVLTGVGLALGQERQVLMKAIYVCLECIGVG